MPARSALNKSDKIFYEALDRCIWNYFNDRFSGSNPQMIKKELSTILIAKGIGADPVNKLVEIMHQCETGAYTNAEMNLNREELLENTEKILSAIESS